MKMEIKHIGTQMILDRLCKCHNGDFEVRTSSKSDCKFFPVPL